jgi:hypothetical protein
MRRKRPLVTKKRIVMACLYVAEKRRVMAYLPVTSRVTASCYVKEGFGNLFTVGKESVLWPHKIKDEGHGLPVCNEKGHGYLVCKRGLGQSVYIWEGSVLWPLKIKEESHGLTCL